jgi:hypothetical protein
MLAMVHPFAIAGVHDMEKALDFSKNTKLVRE